MTRLHRFRHWLSRFQTPPWPSQPLHQARLVVVDVETTGLSMRHDVLISIGAVVIERLGLDFTQQFERTLHADTSRSLDNVLIHGITPSEIAQGDDPRAALADFSNFIGDSPLLAFHAPFDQSMLQRAYRQYLGASLSNLFIDVAELAPAIFPERRPRRETLDSWLQQFGLSVSQRHHAAADALATGELLLLLLQTARRRGIDDLAALQRRLELNRRLQRGRNGGG
ncbi:MAG TPA: 3'-5' exonuclease [Gammaproteobacteria bacterium]|nr:3'-5' exonuclease [Gammaproteobacteria bacterium]